MMIAAAPSPRRRLVRALRAAALAVAAAVSLSSGAPAAAAEPPDLAAAEVQLNDWQRKVERMGREVGALRLSEGALQRLNAESLRIQSDAQALRDQARDLAGERRTLLQALGPKADGEAADVAAQRKLLEAEVAEAEGWGKRAELLLARLDQILDQLSTKRVEMLARELGSAKPLPLDPRNWAVAARELGAVLSLAAVSLRAWFGRFVADEAATRAGFLGLVALALAGFALGRLAAAFARRRLDAAGLPWGRGAAPASPAARMALALLETALRALPWVLAAGFGWRALPAEAALPNAVVMALAGGAAVAAAMLIAGRIAIAVVFAPGHPAWRLARIGDDGARAVARGLQVALVVGAVDAGVVRAAANFENVDAFVAIWALFAAAALFAILLRIQRTTLVHGVALARPLRWSGRALLALAVIAAAAGFAALAHYLSFGVVFSILVLAAAGGAKRMLREGLPLLLDPAGATGASLRQGLSIAPESLRLAQFWGGLALELAILAATAVGFMLAWGATFDDVSVFATRLIEGVRIGSYTFSLADLLLAIAVFLAALTATRYAQGVLEQRVFPGTTLDVGVRHSLRSGLGYVGLVIAAGLAVSTLGINVSNLAFVAGALTVGIGFGLQNIVNNFVSGLILLIERPIKQGDRIVVGGNEGVVLRVNVRATEIETLDKSSLLVPNSELLQSQVLNWTLRDPDARVRVTVRVPATALDAAAGRALLEGCVRAQPDLKTEPAPEILLVDFDAATYSFEIRALIGDVTKLDRVASELRLAADAAIRAATPVAAAVPPAPPGGG